MTLPRIIPILLLDNGRIVKTKKFASPIYIGDPINIVQIFNKKEVDELTILNISKNRFADKIPVNLLKEISSECFSPISYGGGIKSLKEIGEILYAGYEKVILNSSILIYPNLLKEASREFGSSTITASVDYRIIDNKRVIFTQNGQCRSNLDFIDYCDYVQNNGAGELVLTNIDKEGTYTGYDIDLIEHLTDRIKIPIVINGGAKSVSDIKNIVNKKVAAAAGSLFTLRPPHRAVLISYPKL